MDKWIKENLLALLSRKPSHMFNYCRAYPAASKAAINHHLVRSLYLDLTFQERIVAWTLKSSSNL